MTIRVVHSVDGLRRRDLYFAVRHATIVSARRDDFRIVQMSIQRDHLHLIVEADGKRAVSSGIHGFSISTARQINKALTTRGGVPRIGKVIADRFHARPLTGPRAVRNTLAYCLNNWRKHGEDRAPFARTWKVDPFSSGALFFGWQELAHSPVLWPLPATYHPLIVRRPRTWLLESWVREVPGH